MPIFPTKNTRRFSPEIAFSRAKYFAKIAATNEHVVPLPFEPVTPTIGAAQCAKNQFVLDEISAFSAGIFFGATDGERKT